MINFKGDECVEQISILGLGTALPVHRLEQSDVARRLSEALVNEPDAARWTKRLFRQCGVETRFTCEPELQGEAGSNRYLPGSDSPPSTAERMNTYKRESVPLGTEAARKALADAEIAPQEITHLITVSCTGQFLPGLDALLVSQLDLSPRVNRIPLTFQGCAAGLKAIQLARILAEGHEGSNILIVSVELCTLHLQPSHRKEDLFGASFFGDGASACVVGPAKERHKNVFQLLTGHAALLPDTAEDMTWDVDNYGFSLYLSPQIPKLLAQYLPSEIEDLYSRDSLPELWAVHPGGRGIVDAVQQLYELRDEQVQYSRDVLRDYGNLSSSTILFVLHAMKQDLKNRNAAESSGIALAFGPGLTAELVSFTYLPSIQVKQGELSHAAQ